MSMSDPIADMLTRIRNAQMIGDTEVVVPASLVKTAIAKVLKNEGYIQSYRSEEKDGKKQMVFSLKYYKGEPVIARIQRVSRPGRRVYCGVGDLPRVLGGLGIAVISTSQGVMSNRDARAKHQGGEVICTVE